MGSPEYHGRQQVVKLTSPPAVNATIGPGGGKLQLANGTRLTIPPGALIEPVEFRIVPVKRLPTPDDESGIVLVGVAFILQPSGRSLKSYTLSIPTRLLPRGAVPSRMALHLVTPILLGARPGTRGRGGASSRAPERWDRRGAHFEFQYLSPSVVQPYYDPPPKR